MICSNCFIDEGLRISAQQMGIDDDSRCPNCNSDTGKKLNKNAVGSLAHRFFVWGSIQRGDYGAAPVLQFNEHQKTDITPSSWLKNDINLIENFLGVGFFHYGPRLWMLGEVEPLKQLQEPETRNAVIDRILKEYPDTKISSSDQFYRIRKFPAVPNSHTEYDSPPDKHSGNGRLDSPELSVLYGSQDLQTCIHECRVSAEDELYLATMNPLKELRLLNLTAVLDEDHTEFESLDMAIHMLFLAGSYSYEISRAISLAARDAGYSGIAFPSYFSLLRSGSIPFQTTYGISNRKFPGLKEVENSKITPNLAIFGRPIESKLVQISCINRLTLYQVDYGVHFGPVDY